MNLPTLSILAVAAVVSLVAPAFATSALTIAETGFSAGPGTDYGQAKKLALGTHVDVIWCGTHANWCLVDIHNKRGWVPMANLTFKLPHSNLTDDGGTPNGGPTGSSTGGPSGSGGGGPTKSQTAKMAQEAAPPPGGGGGGSGITFSPVNNYTLVKP